MKRLLNPASEPPKSATLPWRDMDAFFEEGEPLELAESAEAVSPREDNKAKRYVLTGLKIPRF